MDVPKYPRGTGSNPDMVCPTNYFLNIFQKNCTSRKKKISSRIYSDKNKQFSKLYNFYSVLVLQLRDSFSSSSSISSSSSLSSTKTISSVLLSSTSCDSTISTAVFSLTSVSALLSLSLESLSTVELDLLFSFLLTSFFDEN